MYEAVLLGIRTLDGSRRRIHWSLCGQPWRPEVGLIQKSPNIYKNAQKSARQFPLLSTTYSSELPSHVNVHLGLNAYIPIPILGLGILTYLYTFKFFFRPILKKEKTVWKRWWWWWCWCRTKRSVKSLRQICSIDYIFMSGPTTTTTSPWSTTRHLILTSRAGRNACSVYFAQPW